MKAVIRYSSYSSSRELSYHGCLEVHITTVAQTPFHSFFGDSEVSNDARQGALMRLRWLGLMHLDL